jgi:hypothetical protein
MIMPWPFIDFTNFVNLSQAFTPFLVPSPGSTFTAVHPQDNNIIAIGMEDYSIEIFDVHTNEVSING